MSDSDQAMLDRTDASVPTPDETPAEKTLSPMDRVRLARDPQRPHTLDYLRELFADFTELHGDRSFGDDRALLGGLATFRGRTVMVMGHQPGTNTRENIERNFGMPRPEGYRKAVRLMAHAQKFGFPIITFIDTPAADPGVGSEERGQGTAIAESLLAMIGTEVPIVCAVIGQGGSGGALAISVGDRLLMLENAIYAVAPPEACAAILWKDASKAPEAAATMRITARDIEGFGIIDEVIPEPIPAHEAPRDTIRAVGDRIEANLAELEASLGDGNPDAIATLLAKRHEKFRRIGAWAEL
ncbi:MAG: acetyl-CoA carboxylase carboxyltransferase subunit alpha [Thermomicrobiales bacterium]